MAIYKNTNGAAELFANVGGGESVTDIDATKFAYNLAQYFTIGSGLSLTVADAMVMYSGGISKLFLTVQATASTTISSTTDIATINDNAPAFIKPTENGYSRLSSRGAVVESVVKTVSNNLTWEVYFNGSQKWNKVTINKVSGDAISLAQNAYLFLEVIYFNNAQVGEGNKEKENVKTYYTSAASGITVSAAYSRVYGNITVLEVALNIASGTTINQGNNTVVTLNNYTQHKDLVPYDHGITMQSYFMASYLPVDAPCEITATLLYNGGIDITMQSGGHTFDSAYTLELRVVFINNRSVSSVGGGSPVTQETYVSIASNLSIVGNLPLSVYYGRMHRYGRDTYLEICLKTTDEWTFTSSSFGVVQITDSDGKLTPFWLDSQHQCVYQCGVASFNGAPLFLARMFYYDATHSTVVFEPSEGKTISAINSEIYLSLHFTNKYDE